MQCHQHIFWDGRSFNICKGLIKLSCIIIITFVKQNQQQEKTNHLHSCLTATSQRKSQRCLKWSLTLTCISFSRKLSHSSSSPLSPNPPLEEMALDMVDCGLVPIVYLEPLLIMVVPPPPCVVCSLPRYLYTRYA